MATIDSVKLPDNSTYNLTDNYSGYQTETLTTPLDINGTQETTVEGALGGLNDYGDALADNLAANENVYGAKNLIPYPYQETDKTNGNVTYTINSDTSVSLSGQSNANPSVFWLGEPRLENKKYIISDGVGIAGIGIRLRVYDTNYTVLASIDTRTLPNGTGEIDLTGIAFSSTDLGIVVSNGVNTGVTIKPMIRDARILDPTFAPYAETNLQLTRKTSGLSNENLVDNPFFTVNQRSSNSYSSPDVLTNVYTVDRWYVFNGQLSVSSNGVTFVHNTNANWGRLVQKLESAYIGRTLTLSILDDNGDIYEVSGVATNGGYLLMSVNSNWRVSVDFSTTGTTVSISSTTSDSSISIRAIKLEVGSVSTLANDVAPDYTTELLKCQRYFYRLTNAVQICVSFASSVDTASVIFNLPVPMRTTPTFTHGGSFYLRYMGANEPVTNIVEGGSNNERIGLSLFISGALTIGQAGYFNASNTSAYLDFSADL